MSSIQCSTDSLAYRSRLASPARSKSYISQQVYGAETQLVGTFHDGKGLSNIERIPREPQMNCFYD